MVRTVSLAAAAEAALAFNRPIYLLEIALDSGTKYYTSDNGDVTFPTSGGYTYAAYPFSFDRIRSTLTNEIDRVNFSFDNSALTFSGYLTAEDFQGRYITLKRVFANLLTTAADATTLFYGEIGPIQITEQTFEFTAVSPMMKLELMVPRRLFQNNCQWGFDSTECRGYNEAGTVAGTTLADEKTGTVEASSTTLKIYDAIHRVAGEGADHWRAGTVEFTSGALNGKKAIVASSTTGAINLLAPLSAAPAAGTTYKIKRGCNKTASDCIRIFDNFQNYGGFTAIPERQK